MKKILALVALGIAVSACGPRGNEPNFELIQDMMYQPAIKAQRYDEFFKNGISEQVPPEHTAPVGMIPYRYGYNADLAEKEMKNPMAGNMTPDVLNVGQRLFETNCMACHGMKGHGDGPVSLKFPIKIPALVSDKIKGWSDTRIYSTITTGQGVMGPYASHIPQASRWQVVNYVRFLQKNDSKQ
jgi:mono/diheme cytochrome c family protein